MVEPNFDDQIQQPTCDYMVEPNMDDLPEASQRSSPAVQVQNNDTVNQSNPRSPSEAESQLESSGPDRGMGMSPTVRLHQIEIVKVHGNFRRVINTFQGREKHLGAFKDACR
ncbi:uncharacterized protein [Ptychodera flava]|uniref:uncharacterized protein n=1 Tax=Ptychodera flava TaxID=63121 RepID=UPI003969D921